MTGKAEHDEAESSALDLLLPARRRSYSASSTYCDEWDIMRIGTGQSTESEEGGTEMSIDKHRHRARIAGTIKVCLQKWVLPW